MWTDQVAFFSCALYERTLSFTRPLTRRTLYSACSRTVSLPFPRCGEGNRFRFRVDPEVFSPIVPMKDIS